MNGKQFSDNILDWYDRHRRDLPWRRSVAPYGIWISEIMAQQTQIDRVVRYWERWMATFPDIHTLANADEDTVVKLWEGLGYYSRARNIRKAAQVIVRDFNGEFPTQPQDIVSLPGVGPYTVGAISSIAFNLPEPAIDANVLRVFSRLLDVDAPIRSAASKTIVEKQVRCCIPEHRPGDFNQALMELGALVCAKVPQCASCPVQSHCKAFTRGTMLQRPVLPSAQKTVQIEMATGVLEHGGRVLIQKRKPDDVWPGLWEFPGGGIEEGESPEQALIREYQEEVELEICALEKITVIRYAYTKYRVTMHCYRCHAVEAAPQPVFHEAVDGGFVTPRRLSEYAFPAGHRRLIEYLMDDERHPFFVQDK